MVDHEKINNLRCLMEQGIQHIQKKNLNFKYEAYKTSPFIREQRF